ncbi:MAG: hypothetical protein MK142_03775 [Pseudomonadales bacterium]|nr:hypothetical protein [Pseudomonadales bacterium]MEE2891219.1 hypothetical protein [Pseudomonadota bacterium]
MKLLRQGSALLALAIAAPTTLAHPGHGASEMHAHPEYVVAGLLFAAAAGYLLRGALRRVNNRGN